MLVDLLHVEGQCGTGYASNELSNLIHLTACAAMGHMCISYPINP